MTSKICCLIKPLLCTCLFWVKGQPSVFSPNSFYFNPRVCNSSWILISTFFATQTMMPLVIFDSKYLSNNGVTRKYFRREFDQDQILDSYYFSNLKFTGFCSKIYIPSIVPTQSLVWSEWLLSKKLARPHWDHFIYFYVPASFTTVLINLTQNYRFLTILTFNLSKEEGKRIDLTCNFNFRNCGRELLNGKQIVVVASKTPERLRFWPSGGGEGATFKILQSVTHYWNFSLTLAFGGGQGSSGSKLENGTWTGIVGDVFEGRATFGVHLGPTAQRDGIIDFTSPYDWYSRIFYIVRPVQGITWKAIYKPFEPSLWLYLGFTLNLFVFMFYLDWRITTEYHYQLVDSAARIFKILLEQNINMKNNWASTVNTRFLLVLCLFFSLLLGTAYRSKLMSFLTKSSPLREIPKTHEELAYSDYTLYFRSYGGIAFLFTNSSTHHVQRKIAGRMQVVRSSTECLSLALLNENSSCMDYNAGGDYAMALNTSLYPFGSKGQEVLVRSEDSGFSSGVIWAFRKGSPLTTDFNLFLLRCRASGLYSHWVREDETQIRIESSQSMKLRNDLVKRKLEEFAETFDQDRKPLSFESLLAVVYLSILGLCLALGHFVGEIAVSTFRKNLKSMKLSWFG